MIVNGYELKPGVDLSCLNDTKVIPFNNVVQKFKIPIEEYCYEDDDFTYTTDP